VDYNNHVNYIHWNPVKHGLVEHVADWPHSSFHKFVAQGVYPVNWCSEGVFDVDGDE
jgi:putative transposase